MMQVSIRVSRTIYSTEIQSKVYFLIEIGPLVITGGEDSRICLWSSEGAAQVGVGGSSSSHSHSPSPSSTEKKIRDRGFKPY